MSYVLRPARAEDRVIIDCGRRCAVCFSLKRDKSRKTGIVSRIDLSDPSTNIDNLIYLCLAHEADHQAQMIGLGQKNLSELKTRVNSIFSPDYALFSRWLKAAETDLQILKSLNEGIALSYFVSELSRMQALLKEIYRLQQTDGLGDLKNSVGEFALIVEHLVRLMDDFSYVPHGDKRLFDSASLKTSFLEEKTTELRDLLEAASHTVDRILSLTDMECHKT